MNAFAKYTLARIGIFVLALAVMTLLGAGRWTAVMGAALISLLVSYLALRGLRDELAQDVAQRVDRRLERRRASAQRESEAEEGGVDQL